MTQCARPTFATRARRAVVVWAALALAAVLTVAATVYPGSQEAQAQSTAATADGVNFGNCSFRAGTGVAENWANQICWLDLTGLPTTNGGTATLTKKVGDYTLKFDVKLESRGTTVKEAATKSPWDQSAFGKTGTGFFERQSSATANDVVAIRGGGLARYTFSNIAITDAAGNRVSNYRFAMADAESTGAGASPGEILDVSNTSPNSKGVTPATRLTPDGYKDACTAKQNGKAIYGPGAEPQASLWGTTGSMQRDFICWVQEDADYRASTRAYGGFIVGVNSPSSMEIAIGSVGGSGQQAFALGIGLSRVEFANKDALATVNKDAENYFLGAESKATANYEAFSRNNATGKESPIKVTEGGTATLMRSLDVNGVPEDTLGFRSSLSNAPNRYNPVWKCVLTTSGGSATSETIRAGAVPASYKLTNQGETSTLLVDSPDNDKLNCTVSWEPKFKPAKLDLSKTVDGNAAGFDEIKLQKYTLHYACRAPEGFAQAYPDVKLEGDAVVEPGTISTVGNLPQGTTCTVTERVAQPPAGTDLKLSWNKGVAGDAKAPVTVVLPTTGAAPTAVGAASANNNYSYRAGSLNFSKTIVGDPVTDGKVGGTYRFRLVCAGTDVKREFELNLTSAKPSAATKLDGIPVERDCSIAPLTDLTQKQRETIQFISRDATLAGQPATPDAAGAYHFTLREGTTPELHFTTSYDYLTFPLFVRNEVNGLAAGAADVERLRYTVHYRCQVEGRTVAEGTATLNGSQGEARIDDIPASASCTVWEDLPGDTATTLFKGAKVRASDASDQATTLTNEEAKTQPVTTIRVVSGTDRNQVTLVNTFDPKLGTVSLRKVVDAQVQGALPQSYAFTFRCGSRNVATSVAGQSRALELTGRATVAADGTVTLTANDAAANDQNGAMGVPYGNTCTFAEETPKVAGGILFSTDVQDVKLGVDAAQNTATVTNTYRPAGNGLTVSLRTGGRESLALSSLSYALNCDNGFTESFDLAPGERRAFTAAQVPQGTACTLTETGDSATRTTADGRDYPIQATSEYLYASDAEDITAVDNGGEFVIGMQSTMDVHHEYDFIEAPVAGTKQVVFNDPNNLISEPRRAIKSNRIFPVNLVCTNPDGTAGPNISTTVQQGQAPGGTRAAAGSTCTITEGDTTTAVGITLRKAIDVNGARTDGGTAKFTVDDAKGVTLLFVNTYERRTTSIELTKRAILPTDAIRAQYANAGKDLQESLYNHAFSLVCRDPETGDTAVLQQQSGAIKGEGSTTFDGVPVGADCQLTGDQFGSLALEMNDGTDDLKAFLRPAFVDWVVDREGGNAYPDQNLDNDTTTSPVFLTVDDPAKNHVRLDNHYEYETSTVRLSKDLAGAAGNLDEIPEDYTFNFALQCKAVGYQTSSVGETSFIPEKLRPADGYVIPASIRKGDFTDGTFISGEAKVPAGSLCTFNEQDATNVPEALTIAPEQKIVRGYAPNPGETAPADLHFVNKVERRTTPVRLAVFNSGYLAEADEAGYTAQLRCDDPAQTAVTRQFPLTALSGSEMPRSFEAPAGGQVVDLPVGANCTLDFAGSAALAARGQLEVTDGARTPLAQYATWGSGSPALPTGSLSNLAPDEVNGSDKAYSYTFATAANLPSAETALTVGADIYHPRAHYDVAFTKTAAGPSSGTFTFHQSCSSQSEEFQLRAGETHTIADVPVDSDCAVDEIDDGNPDAVSVFQVVSNGELVTPLEGDTDSVLFTAQPVSDPTDLARSGDRWSLTAKNTFPGVKVQKLIDGTPLGQLTGDAFGTTLLRHDATSMQMTYTVTNTGEFPLKDFTVTDPSLAGLDVTRGGVVTRIGDDGAVPDSICPTTELAAGEEFSCTFNVSIPASANETWRYPAEGDAAVTVAATANAGGAAQTVKAADAQGALKPSASLSMLLPETGEQTLVLFLLLGLVLFGWGAWRVSRRDERAEGGELVEM